LPSTFQAFVRRNISCFHSSPSFADATHPSLSEDTQSQRLPPAHQNSETSTIGTASSSSSTQITHLRPRSSTAPRIMHRTSQQRMVITPERPISSPSTHTDTRERDPQLRTSPSIQITPPRSSTAPRIRRRIPQQRVIAANERSINRSTIHTETEELEHSPTRHPPRQTMTEDTTSQHSTPVIAPTVSSPDTSSSSTLSSASASSYTSSPPYPSPPAADFTQRQERPTSQRHSPPHYNDSSSTSYDYNEYSQEYDTRSHTGSAT
ncbi:hypothetical protein ADUPG1_003789, partial [Aduncisulcus paluster]